MMLCLKTYYVFVKRSRGSQKGLSNHQFKSLIFQFVWMLEANVVDDIIIISTKNTLLIA